MHNINLRTQLTEKDLKLNNALTSFCFFYLFPYVLWRFILLRFFVEINLRLILICTLFIDSEVIYMFYYSFCFIYMFLKNHLYILIFLLFCNAIFKHSYRLSTSHFFQFKNFHCHLFIFYFVFPFFFFCSSSPFQLGNNLSLMLPLYYNTFM